MVQSSLQLAAGSRLLVISGYVQVHCRIFQQYVWDFFQSEDRAGYAGILVDSTAITDAFWQQFDMVLKFPRLDARLIKQV